MKEESCAVGPGPSLRLLEIRIDPGLELTRHALLASPDGCCSQTVLPFAARVIGTVANRGDEECCVTVSVTLHDRQGTPHGTFEDLLFVDPSRRGEFDVKLSEAVRVAASYSLHIRTTTGPDR